MHKLALFFGVFGSATAASIPISLYSAPTQTSYLLRTDRSKGAVDRVEVKYQASGDLKLVEQGKPRREKMSVAADFQYDEKTLEFPEDDDGTLRSIRYYEKAEGVVKSGEYGYTPRLRDERRLIGAAIDGHTVTLFSPRGPLTSDEWELIDVQANSLLLDRLLPATATRPGGTWKLADDLVLALLRLDTLTANRVESVLQKVDQGRAQIDLSGPASGIARGAATRMELKGKCYFNLASKRITWFGLLVREARSAGHVDAGFDAVTRLQMKITPNTSSARLADRRLLDVSLKPTTELTQIGYESPAGKWRLAHDRRWFVVSDDEDRAIFRLVERGERVAQCSVASLANDADPTRLTLEAFQRDVAHALGDNMKNFVRAEQWHSEADYRVFRVVAEGEASEMPMQWIYYLVSDKHGGRVALTFVVAGDQVEHLGQADRGFVRNLRLTEPKIASKP